MKKLLLGSVALSALVFGGPASAADYAPAAKAPPPPPLFNWSGFYAGIHVGGGWGTKHWFGADTFAGVDEGFHRVRGAIAGGQVGINYQVAHWVIGIEAQASFAELNGSHHDSVFGGDVNHTRVQALGTLAARLGYAFNRTLPYVKLGGAWVRDKYFVSDFETPDTEREVGRADRSGWMFGLGVEHAFYDNWSVKVEYNHMDFGIKRTAFHNLASVFLYNQDIAQQISIVKLGINYRFGYGPVYSKY